MWASPGFLRSCGQICSSVLNRELLPLSLSLSLCLSLSPSLCLSLCVSVILSFCLSLALCVSVSPSLEDGITLGGSPTDSDQVWKAYQRPMKNCRPAQTKVLLSTPTLSLSLCLSSTFPLSPSFLLTSSLITSSPPPSPPLFHLLSFTSSLLTLQSAPVHTLKTSPNKGCRFRLISYVCVAWFFFVCLFVLTLSLSLSLSVSLSLSHTHTRTLSVNYCITPNFPLILRHRMEPKERNVSWLSNIEVGNFLSHTGTHTHFGSALFFFLGSF